MPTLKPVTKILLHITVEHIQQARAIRRAGNWWFRPPIYSICPVALAAHEFFARPCRAGCTTIGVMNELDGQEEYFLVFLHDGEKTIAEFDNKGTCNPITITLTRNT